MTKDEKIEKLKSIINRLIYSNWDVKSAENEAYLFYSPYRIIVKCKDDDVICDIQKKFLNSIYEIEKIKEQ